MTLRLTRLLDWLLAWLAGPGQELSRPQSSTKEQTRDDRLDAERELEIRLITSGWM
jgi:hypothetical protein